LISSLFVSLNRHRHLLEHFPAKWEPVRRRKCDQIKNLERVPDSTKAGRALADIHAAVSIITPAAMSATVRKRLKSKALPAILFFGLIDSDQPSWNRGVMGK
jgi:hypothetical protein